ncbi:DUF2309 domain-containing protein [Blastopirellula sp. JC733]|nr:DUF2309 domain-containing protein [Blastopirellula sediminis]
MRNATSPPTFESSRQSQQEILEAIEHAAEYLPAQGPITSFVHHNTLHAFEDLTFDEGVRIGGSLFQCHEYLPEEKYREHLHRGRITASDLDAVLVEDLGEEVDRLVASFGSRHALRFAMLRYPLFFGDRHELHWVVSETDALSKFRSDVDPGVRDRMIKRTRQWVLRNRQQIEGRSPGDEDPLSRTLSRFQSVKFDSWDDATWEKFVLNFLWRVCRDGVATAQNSTDTADETTFVRHRDALLAATGGDADVIVHEHLVSFCAAFLDQGYATLAPPNRGQGFYLSFLSLYSQGWGAPTRWLANLQQESQRLLARNFSPLDSIEESLTLLGVDREERSVFIRDELLALRGWAGMIWQLESNPKWETPSTFHCNLTEFLAVRLMLVRLALQRIAAAGGDSSVRLDQIRERYQGQKRSSQTDDRELLAYVLFQLAQVRGWRPDELHHLQHEQWTSLVGEVNAFSSLDRRRIYHAAYERKYAREALDALLAYSKRRTRETTAPAKGESPSFQAITCLDDREESFRRHLEEIDPSCETYGTAGFFGVAMSYRGIADARFVSLCPVNVVPRHQVVETPDFSAARSEERLAQTRRHIGRATHQAHLASRTFLGGTIAGLLGSALAFVLVVRVIFPRLASYAHRQARSLIYTNRTTLQLEQDSTSPEGEERLRGYCVEEMGEIVKGLLKSVGLTGNWAPLVVLLGHGSASLNNPHESAYNCGACAGGRGGPNARAFAAMANDLRVRRLLAEQGLEIPETTFFVGGYHDTTNDAVTFADVDHVPHSHRQRFEEVVRTCDEARRRNAQERCRRFESADLNISPADALRHVENRPEDLSQPRPEYNHATNAMCIVGRRENVRGLFLDRRAFLASYDPTQDDANGTVLESQLRAVIPVCAGINLEYYFSTVDPEGYGCGSKLPHNITSLLGVMTGAASDLRPGLSTQMIEIHEPMRLLFVIETTTEVMQRIIECNETIARLAKGKWIQLAVIDYASAQVWRFDGARFIQYMPEEDELPVAASSYAWYQGRRGNLPFAEIAPSSAGLGG